MSAPGGAPQGKRGVRSVSKLELPPEAEAWLNEQFLAYPDAAAERKGQWLQQIQKKWEPTYTEPHLTTWIRVKRAHITRSKNASKKQAADREKKMEAQLFPRMLDNAKTVLRDFYKMEQQPTQSLMDSWSTVAGVPGTEVARWLQWKRAYDETTEANLARAQSGSVNSTTSIRPESTASPLATGQKPVPPPTAARPSSVSKPAAHKSIASLYASDNLPPPLPPPSPAGLVPRGHPASQAGTSYSAIHHPPRSNSQSYSSPMHHPPHPDNRGQPFAAPYPPGYGAYDPHSLRAPAPYPSGSTARPRDPYLPPIAVLEHGQHGRQPEPSTQTSTSRQRQHVAPISTNVPRHPAQQLSHPVSPLEKKPYGSAQASRPNTAPSHPTARRRSHSPERLSPSHRTAKNGPPPRRPSPPGSPTSSPTSIFRYALPQTGGGGAAGSPSASIGALSAIGSHAVGGSEPPLTPTPSPYAASAVLRHDTPVSNVTHHSSTSPSSSRSRTVTANPLAPLFSDIGSLLRKQGILNERYPVDLSLVPTRDTIPRPRRAASTAQQLDEAGGSNNRTASTDFASWFAAASSTLDRRLPAGRREELEGIEARQSEMLRDIESGAFAHFGLAPEPRKPKPEPDA